MYYKNLFDIFNHPLMERKFDIIIYGASGFAASYIVRELIKTNPHFALAGRNKERIVKNLSTLLSESQISKITIFESNSEDLDPILLQTKVLINCAGPYIYSGEVIVKKCIENKTHYLDITGETYFIERCIALYGKLAEENKVFIINCAGFDSVPADIGAQYLKNSFDSSEQVIIDSILVCKDVFINKTTYESAVQGFAKAKQTAILRKKNHTKTNLVKTKLKKVFYSEELGSYCVVFPGTDASVVKRTQSTLYLKDEKTPAIYKAYVKIGGLFKTSIAAVFGCFFLLFSKTTFGRFLLIRFSYIFTLGAVKDRRPTMAEVDNGSFVFQMTGKSHSGSKRLHIIGPDPGYVTTAICITQLAFILLDNFDEKNETLMNDFKGGVLTPASAFNAEAVVNRLNANGVQFKFIANK